jgi:hypothetical protein
MGTANAPTAPSPTSFGSERSPGSVPVANAAEATPKEEATTKTTPTEPMVAMPFGSSGGSSLAGKLVPKAASAKPAPAVASEDPGTPLNMAGGGYSHSSPKPKANAMGEVASMLNQMKSLFNMDEPLPIDENGGMRPMAGIGAEYPGALTGATMPGANPDEQYAGENGEMAMNEPSQEAPGEMPDTMVQGAILSGQPDSLFVRVHLRPRKCLERGLLVMHIK